MEEQNIFDKSKLANYKLSELKKTRKFEMIEDLLNTLKLNSNNHKAILEKEKNKAIKDCITTQEAQEVINILEEKAALIKQEKYKKDVVNDILNDRKKDTE